MAVVGHPALQTILPQKDSFLSSASASSVMDYDCKERRKKSDKAKDKAGRPSSKHVRAYEALAEKRRAAGPPPAAQAPRK